LRLPDPLAPSEPLKLFQIIYPMTGIELARRFNRVKAETQAERITIYHQLADELLMAQYGSSPD
jgi:hypothetical protein